MRLSEAIALLDHKSLRTHIESQAHPASSQSTAPSADLPQYAIRFPRWADLGCGDGLFTEALAHFLPKGSTLYGIDLRPRLHTASVNGVTLVPQYGDFITMPLPDDMDGFLMANAFHYVQDKPALLQKMRQQFRTPDGAQFHSPAGSLLIVEYDTDQPVPTWVPWPVSYRSLQSLLQSTGWHDIEKLGSIPSSYGGNIYAALARSPLT